MRTESTYRPQESRRIEDAYRELSQEAFSGWLMLCVHGCTVKGRAEAARLLGMSYRRTSVILRELRNKGFVDVKPGSNPSIHTEIMVRIQAVVGGRAWIVRLGAPSC